MKPVAQRPRGTQDILPTDQPHWDAMRRAAERQCALYGYRLIETPIFEQTSLFSRSAGETSDVVTKEMYTFADRGNRSLTLRPEGTAPVMRAYFDGGLFNEKQPVRLYYLGPFFRYDRPQAGRYREFHQFGVEAIGPAYPDIDVEVIELGWLWFSRLGINQTSLQLNSIGDEVCRPAYRELLRDYYRPHLPELSDEDRLRFDRNPLRLLDCKEPSCQPLKAEAPRIIDHLCEPCSTAFQYVQEGLKGAGIPFVIRPDLVRGLDYYTRTTFEFWHSSLGGSQNSLGGGGRYDGLARELGYRDTPGIGFALGLERTALILKELGNPPAIYAIAVEESSRKHLERIAQELFDRGLQVVVDRSIGRLDSKMRNAARQGAYLTLIVGPTEDSSGSAIVHHMRDKTEVAVSDDKVAEAVLKALATYSAESV